METELTASQDGLMEGEVVKPVTIENDPIIKTPELPVDVGAGDSPRRRQEPDVTGDEVINKEPPPTDDTQVQEQGAEPDESGSNDNIDASIEAECSGSDGNDVALSDEDEEEALEETSGDEDSNDGFPEDDEDSEEDENTLSQRIYEIFESSKSSTLEGLFDRLVDSHHQLTLLECKNESCHRNFLNFMSDVKAFENYLRNPKPGIPENKYLPLFYIYLYAKICSFALLDRKRQLNHICCEQLGRNPSWLVRDLLTASATTLWQLLPPKERKNEDLKKEEEDEDGRGDDGKSPAKATDEGAATKKEPESGDQTTEPPTDEESKEATNELIPTEEEVKDDMPDSPSKDAKTREDETDDLLPEHLIACCRLFANYNKLNSESLRLELGDFINRVDAVFHTLHVPCTDADDCAICKDQSAVETSLSSDQIGLFCASISDEIDLLKFQTQPPGFDELDENPESANEIGDEAKDGIHAGDSKPKPDDVNAAESGDGPKTSSDATNDVVSETRRKEEEDIAQQSKEVGTSTDVFSDVGDILRQFSPRELGKTWGGFVEFLKSEPSRFDKHLTLNELYSVVGTHIHFYCPWKLLLEREEVTYRTINNNLELEKERVQRCLDYLAAMCEGITFPKDTVKRLFEHIAYYVEDDAFMLRFSDRCRSQVDSEMGSLDFTSEYDGAGEWTLGACVCGSNAD